jgi:hypothetical protein
MYRHCGQRQYHGRGAIHSWRGHSFEVVLDDIGNIYTADTGNDRIAEVDTSSNGTVLYSDSITLNGPLELSVDHFGTVSVADTGNSRGIVVDPPVNGDLAPGDQSYSPNQSDVGFGHVQLGSAGAVTLTLPFATGEVPTASGLIMPGIFRHAVLFVGAFTSLAALAQHHPADSSPATIDVAVTYVAERAQIASTPCGFLV